ncbi:MAG: VOC family protein [Verrucomicrobiota bacterium]
MTTRLNLIVLRSPDIDRAIVFYEKLGISFAKHCHGKGPEHYASILDHCVFEIYPLVPTQTNKIGTRIGFQVEDLDKKINLVRDLDCEILSPAKDSPWGRRAVAKDFDGHKVELIELPENKSEPLTADVS